MRKQQVITVAALLVALLAWAPAATFADEHSPLKDAGFEGQLPADEGGWSMFEISLFSKNYARGGERSMFNGGFSRTVPFQPFFVGNDSGAYQELPATAGSRWRLTGYGLTPAPLEGAPAFGIIQISFFDADGEDLGTVETADIDTKAKTSSEVNHKSPAGEWIMLDTGVATAPEGTASVQVFTIYIDHSGSNKTQGVYFDDLSLCALADDESECEAAGD